MRPSSKSWEIADVELGPAADVCTLRGSALCTEI